MIFNSETKIGDIWIHEETGSIVLKYVPEIVELPHLAFLYKNFTLEQYTQFNRLVEASQWIPAFLDDLAGVDLQTPVVRASRETVPSSDYEDDSISIGSAVVNHPAFNGQWDVFEIELRGPKHGNPYVDVEVGAEFANANRTIRIPGFYDGDGVYRIRFMPDTQGGWTYRTYSNARSLEGITGSFDCMDAPEGNHGPVRVKNTYHFAYEDGTPYIPVGTTCYAWTHQGKELEERTLKTLAGSPFNKIRMCVFPKSYLFNLNEPIDEMFERTERGGGISRNLTPTFSVAWRTGFRISESLASRSISFCFILMTDGDMPRWIRQRTTVTCGIS